MLLKPPRQEPSATAALRDTYLANLGALYRADAALAGAIDALPFAACPPLEAARDGRLTARLTGHDGKTLYAHSRYEPAVEAQRTIDALPNVAHPTFFVAGIGLGYHLTALEARFDRPLLIVAEPELPLIKAALCVCDLRDMIDEQRLILLRSGDKAELHEKLLPRYADVLLGMQFVTLPYTLRRRPAHFETVRAHLADFAAYARMQMVTLLKNARTTCRNVAMNAAAYVRWPGIDALEGRARGYPAIVVAAGPSLAAVLDALPTLADRAVIIAVQTVFKLLLSRGVRPHFVTSLDFHEVSGEYFRGVRDVGDCTLVVEPKVTWRVVDAYPGRIRMTQARLSESLLRNAAAPRAALKGGSTVAHLAFYLARYIGCDPILLVGQDLCYADGLYYPPGTPIENIWQPELSRFQTIEMKQWERIVRGRPILRTVTTADGRSAFSDEQLVSYAEQFASDLAGCGVRVFQTAPGGIALPGADFLPFSTAVEKYCSRALPPELFPPAEPADSRTTAQAAFELEARLTEVQALHAISREMRAQLERLRDAVEDPPRFNRLLLRIDDLRTRIRQFDRTYGLIVEAAQLGELRRHSADRRMGVEQRETPATARRRLQRDCEFVDAFIEGCEFMEAMLPEAIAHATRPPIAGDGR